VFSDGPQLLAVAWAQAAEQRAVDAGAAHDGAQ
jgi:hypothetical protein